MYAQFFGLHKLPFRMRPDAEFRYPAVDYLRARSRLLDGLKDRHRLVLLLGHGGLGKTLLLEDMLKGLGADCACCRINQPHISASELLEALVLQLGTSLDEGNEHSPRSYADLLASLASIGERRSAPLLIVDDAHLLPPPTSMALVEILTRAPNIKMVLSGRSGLGLEEMAARFLAGEPQVVRMLPLDQAETRSYIDHRLSAGGGRNRELIAADAHTLIFDHTAGVPRLINVLCDAALHAACLRASGQVTRAEILLATQDSRWPEALARDRPGAGRRETSASGFSEASIPLTPIQAQIVVTIGEEILSTWPLPPGRVRIGRAFDNEFRLEAHFISRHHCQVITVGSVSTIEDLGSVNGIAVNGRMVKQHVLRHADRVQLGDHTLTYFQC